MTLKQVQKLSEYRLMIRVAELHGWKYERHMGLNTYIRNSVRIHEDCLPFYANDLNAMHEAWKGLTVGQKVTFKRVLVKDMRLGVFMWGNATARQRAEAFVLTMEGSK